MAELHLTDPRDSLKMLRETLCVAQMALSGLHRGRIQRMINEIDRQRPLGPDGTHGERHTLTCGCELEHPLHGEDSLGHGYIEGECDDWCNNGQCLEGKQHERCTPTCSRPCPNCNGVGCVMCRRDHGPRYDRESERE